VVVVTSKVLEEAERRRLQNLGAAAIVSKAADRDTAMTQLRTVLVGVGLVAP
jgi:DNA-binding NarL/FixJ family response regulator